MQPSYATGTTTGADENIVTAIKASQTNPDILINGYVFKIKHFSIWSLVPFSLKIDKGEYMPAQDPLGIGRYEYNLVGSSIPLNAGFIATNKIYIETSGTEWFINFIY